ncbi:hypothetical protein PR048_026689 [Dryococelus australis]|uniref:Uncharacterized protein n=1 Tax=Dryococelus australis TaxID=614101 RepID=A0ABQ9GM31_9NEOP|nr:hypothetical protein PR048_026689 [Dryococelus australis]
MEYIIKEHCDMYCTLGERHGNANAAAERYHDCRHPTANTIRRLDQWAQESRQIMPGQDTNHGRQSYRSMLQVKEKVLQMFAKNLTLSSRPAGQHLGVNHSLVMTILHNHGLYLYHYSTIDHKHVVWYSGYLVSGTVSVARHPHWTVVCYVSPLDSARVVGRHSTDLPKSYVVLT